MNTVIDRLKMNDGSFEADPIVSKEETSLEFALRCFWEDESPDFCIAVICAPIGFDFDENVLTQFLQKYVTHRKIKVINDSLYDTGANCFCAVLHEKDIVGMLCAANDIFSTVLCALTVDSKASTTIASFTGFYNRIKAINALELLEQFFDARMADTIDREWRDGYALTSGKPEIKLVAVLQEDEFDVFKDTCKHFPTQIKHVVRIPSKEFLLDFYLNTTMLADKTVAKQYYCEIGRLFLGLIQDETLGDDMQFRIFTEKIDEVPNEVFSASEKRKITDIYISLRNEYLKLDKNSIPNRIDEPEHN